MIGLHLCSSAEDALRLQCWSCRDLANQVEQVRVVSVDEQLGPVSLQCNVEELSVIQSMTLQYFFSRSPFQPQVMIDNTLQFLSLLRLQWRK